MSEESLGRIGSGEYNAQLDKINRSNRISKLKLSDINLENDQFLFRNHYGYFECKLCCTHHKTESNYIAHTFGKVHKRNLERRQIVLAKKEAFNGGVRIGSQPKIENLKIKQIRIGEPIYNIYKKKDFNLKEFIILFEIKFEEIRKNIKPKYRIMSSFEQKIEEPNPKYQFILFAAQPYNTIGIKIPNFPILKEKTLEDWQIIEKTYTLQLFLKHNIF